MLVEGIFSRYHRAIQAICNKRYLLELFANYMKNKIKICIRVIVIAVVLAILLRTQDLRQLSSTLSSVKLHALMISILVFLWSGFVVALRWYVLIKSQSISISLLAAIKVNFLGLFYNNFLFSAIGGDLLRAWYITHHTQKKLEAAFSVVVDRAIGFFVVILMAGVGFPFLLANKSDQQQTSVPQINGGVTQFFDDKITVVVLLVGFLLAVGLVFALNRKLREKCTMLFRKVISAKDRLAQAVKLYWQNPIAVILAIVLTFVAQVSTIIAIYILGTSMGINVPLKYYFVVFPVGWMVSAIPITPGGIGVLELGIVAMFAFVPSGDKEVGLALALCQRAIFLIGSLPGIFIHLSGAHLPKAKSEFSVDSDELIN